MRRSIRIGVAGAAALASAAVAIATGAGQADAAPVSALDAAFCKTAADYTIPLGSLGTLNLGLRLLSGPAEYNTITVCYDGQPVQASVIAVTSLASGYITIDIPPAAPVVIPIALPL